MCGSENQASTNGTTTTKLNSPSLSSNIVLNLDHGDPTVYEAYWKRLEEKCTVVIKGSELMSYISDVEKPCWFMEQDLENAIKKLHRLTGNAVVDDRYVVVGTGSTQLYQSLLYAITTTSFAGDGDGNGDGDNNPLHHDQLPVPVVCAAPYYSQYAEEADYLRSGLYKWGGDAYAFDKDGPYIEVVTSPNNPDGTTREAVVISDQGKIIYDMAYYWPQYTPITRPANHDIMYFTFSKSTGHAGSRIGYVTNEAIARKMTKFIELSSIGVSKDSQIRAAKIMKVICDDYQDFKSHNNNNNNNTHFFEFSRKLMENRWKRLREVVGRSNVFSLPKYSQEYCLFNGECTESYPAFAWLKVKEEGVEDCEKLLKEYKILGRGGKRFGSDSSYTRVSILSREDVFQQFLDRLESIKAN
ncbi:hypothetical protein F8388_014885 [Cannabis sativa]|uniref:Alliinase C-terminal domain-containing protein n=1 Tax=Cannabis sativa TaxID=3483 RepID=A0A7J6HKP6_CANSA|nr:hypothetical protein F8388_014885 [Cannabis sativa]KAF4395561.1 hypothetical protein G4B88_011025 [Cannabis sativa]